MNQKYQAQIKPVWTWADQISKYRFWGLLIFYCLSAISLGILSSYMSVILRTEAGIDYSTISNVYLLMGIGGILGFYLAWITTRYNPKTMLIVTGIMQLIGGLLITAPNPTSSSIFLYMAGAFLLGLGAGAITLAIPSLLAGGRGGIETFAIAFGIIFVFSRIGQMEATMLLGVFYNTTGAIAITITVGTCMVLGLLFVIPVNPLLFRESPPERGNSFSPIHRDPLLVALSCLIPFYWLYWIYKAHGEVASLAPYASSRSILSPRASVIANLFIPFIYPIIITTLIDALNNHALENDKSPYRSSLTILFWSFVFFPIAMALVQSTMNTVMSEKEIEEAG